MWALFISVLILHFSSSIYIYKIQMKLLNMTTLPYIILKHKYRIGLTMADYGGALKVDCHILSEKGANMLAMQGHSFIG